MVKTFAESKRGGEIHMKRWNYKKICCVCLSAILLTCTVPQVYGKTVSELEAEREELSKQTEEALAAIEDLESKQLSVEEEMDAMDQAMNSLQAEMDAAQEELDRIEASLEQSQKDLEEATKKRDEQFDLLCKRLKYLQQKGAEGYMEILLEAESFSDLFLRMQYVNDIMEYDKELLDQLQETQKVIEEKTKQIEEDKIAQEKVVAEYNEKYASMEEVLQEKKELVASYQQDVEKYEQMIEANKKADQEVLNELAKQQRQQQQSGSSSTDNTVYYTGGGSLGWPVPAKAASSSSLSSGFVSRSNPVTGKWESHSGYDIPAPYGSAIVAAEGGTVTYAGWMNGYGYTVMINHGGGLTTLYGHNSSLTVSKGQTVNRGQTIAKCGSTGMSTGNHCHFSVLVNGSYVNPESYLGVPNVTY